jgi:ribosomal protein S18 acetylase RimI-like enzyme
MTVRRATEADEAVLHELWEAFHREVPDPEGFEAETWEDEWTDVRRDLERGAVFLAEDDDGVVGVARAERNNFGASHLHLVYVRPRVRRQGVTKALLRACVEEAKQSGAGMVSLHVLKANEEATAVWRRLGFEEVSYFMATPLDKLEHRLDEPTGPTEGAVYAQTDDEGRVRTAAERFLPRLGRPEGTEVSSTGTGWVSVREPIVSRDRKLLQRLAQELSLTSGAVTVALGIELGSAVRYALYDRGGLVDEYLSVPELYGPLPPGDVVALGANPRVVARLTGADPERVRQVARTASSPDELPPAGELRDAIATLLGLS